MLSPEHSGWLKMANLSAVDHGRTATGSQFDSSKKTCTLTVATCYRELKPEFMGVTFVNGL